MLHIIKRMLLTVVMLAMVCGTAFADGEKISQLLITGNRRIESAAISKVLKLKEGDTLFADKVDEDIRAI